MHVSGRLLVVIALLMAGPAVRGGDLQAIFDEAKARYLRKDLKNTDWRELRKNLLNAIEEHRTEASKSPETSRLLGRLEALVGAANLELGERKPALNNFAQAVERDPALFVCWNNAGVLEFERNRLVRAIERFSAAAQAAAGNPDVVRFKPFRDATGRRPDGRTAFETVVDNLAEALHAYKWQMEEAASDAEPPDKVKEAQECFQRLEDALKQAKSRSSHPIRRGTRWLSTREEYDRSKQHRDLQAKLNRAKREVEQWQKAKEDAQQRANKCNQEARRSARRKQYWERKRDEAVQDAMQADETLRTRLEEVKELTAELRTLEERDYSKSCSLLTPEDDPLFWRTGRANQQPDTQPSP